MAKRYRPDRVMFGTLLALLVIGIVTVFSSSAVYASELFGSPAMFLIRQALWVALGLGGLFALLTLDYRRFRHPGAIFTAVFIVLALLVAVLFWEPIRNTHRWLHWGSFSLQPSELAKLVLILFLAYFLERRRHAVNDLGGTLLPAAAITGAFCGLVVIEPDLGTAATLALIALAMFFAAGVHLRYLLYLVLAAAPLLYFLVVRVPYRMARIQAFLDPASDPQGAGFQTIQSILAIGSGGVTGAGLMQGKQKLFYLPEAHTDFAYAVVGEELGLLGAVTVVVLFAVLGWRGLRLAQRAPDGFARLLTVGITTMIVGQALVNLSVVLGLLPTKGMPLPFISYGGSDVLVMLLGMGLLLNLSQHAD